jgi:N-acetylglucosaminyldiphosphoundecaprenol N-acetyl-beta-D-mannosaminyltransferase
MGEDRPGLKQMDDFDRNVYCLLGLPFDAVDMAAAVRRVRDAASKGERCFLSTPNLNFLIGCRRDPAFRDSVVHSDLSIADGMPLVWIARLLGLPIRERVAGSGLFEVLRESRAAFEEPLKIYFFGGPDGMAERACKVLNERPSGVCCVGWQSPGFESVESMSGDERIDPINASKADFLVVALGARKGQTWIERNLDRVDVPVVSHLGAVVNFVAGSVNRAPLWMQRTGLEWLWRIKEEPGLWRRYWHDGLGLFQLVFSVVLPYAFWRRFGRQHQTELVVDLERSDDLSRVIVSGSVPETIPDRLRSVFRQAAEHRNQVVLDISKVDHFGPAFIGLVLVLKKRLDGQGLPLTVSGVSDGTRRLFRWNLADYLLP